LPEEIADAVETAPKYAEGRGVRITVRNGRTLAAVMKLVAAKMNT
jgi:hypothetical protein